MQRTRFSDRDDHRDVCSDECGLVLLEIRDQVYFVFFNLLVQDVKGPWAQVTEHLKINGDLKTLSQMVREMERKAQQQVTNLIHVVDRKESTLQETHQQAHKLQNMVDIVEARRVQVEKEKSELQEAHKKGRNIMHFPMSQKNDAELRFPHDLIWTEPSYTIRIL